jgi:hypothetical protein
MPVTYGSSLEEWLSAKPRILISPGADKTLISSSNDLDEKFRTTGKVSSQYVDTFWTNRPAGVVGSRKAQLVEAALNFEYMWGYNHPGWKIHNLLPGIDVGGPWIKHDIIIATLGQEIDAHFRLSGNTWDDYQGMLCASQEVTAIAGHLQGTALSSDLTWIRGLAPVLLQAPVINALGATAIARVEPTHPAADLSIALGELYRDGLPSLPGKAKGNLGSEYLNMQFGWAPTISDGRDFINSIRNFDQITGQFIRDSGRIVKRRFDFDLIESTSVTTTPNSPPVPLSGGVAPSGQQVQLGTLTKTVKTVTRKWFSGAFTYHLSPNVLLRNIQILDKAYGLVPGPDTAWALTPYSWLFDWFSNAGDVIHNLNAFSAGGLVMPWGYMMCDTSTYTEYVLQTRKRDSNSVLQPLVLSSAVIKRTRQRQRANPFGFGLTWDGLNPFQLSILAALGLSRGRLAW